MKVLLEGSATMTLEQLRSMSEPGTKLLVSEVTRQQVERSRTMLEKFVDEGRVIYGVNTSVGGLVHMLVPTERATTLQNNLINAVATNVGDYLDDHTVRAIMLARIKSLARGHSAISLRNFDNYVEVFNSGIVPCIPEKGSLGTSGDLGPLAAIALVLTGQWKVHYRGEIMPAKTALDEAGIKPSQLSFKEGLALVNGTSGMVGLGSLILTRALELFDTYLGISALACEGLAAKTKPFDPRVHMLKPHPGQKLVAETMWKLLKDSEMAVDEIAVERMLSAEMNNTTHAGKAPIEDCYSIRCTPQILGPVIDSLLFAAVTLENELNSSNDNPLLITEEAEVFHNGHFHGQYVSMAMDHVSIALTTLCNLSDRRIDRFLTEANSNGLPPFLCRENPGLRLGLMGGQFMSTSLTAENRSLSMPVSIQSLPSTGDFQDIVSLGFVAARRAREILENTVNVVTFELLCACQAADIRGATQLSSEGRKLYDRVRTIVPYFDFDVALTDYQESLAAEFFGEKTSMNRKLIP